MVRAAQGAGHDVEDRSSELKAAAFVADGHGIGIDHAGQLEARRSAQGAPAYEQSMSVHHADGGGVGHVATSRRDVEGREMRTGQYLKNLSTSLDA